MISNQEFVKCQDDPKEKNAQIEEDQSVISVQDTLQLNREDEDEILEQLKHDKMQTIMEEPEESLEQNDNKLVSKAVEVIKLDESTSQNLKEQKSQNIEMIVDTPIQKIESVERLFESSEIIQNEREIDHPSPGKMNHMSTINEPLKSSEIAPEKGE